MEKLFETLAKIEQKANRMIDNAHSYHSTLEQEKEERLKKLEQEFQNRQKEKISALQTKIEQDISYQKQQLQSETQKQLNTLNKMQEEDLIKIADRIVTNILEGALL